MEEYIHGVNISLFYWIKTKIKSSRIQPSIYSVLNISGPGHAEKPNF